MKPEAQRIAIAKACGWKLEAVKTDASLGEPSWILTRPDGSLIGERSWIGLQKNLPDYLNDLNEMHEVEASLGIVKSAEYERLLDETTNKDYLNNETCFSYPAWYATAAQRAEAFLKTLGLWKDE